MFPNEQVLAVLVAGGVALDVESWSERLWEPWSSAVGECAHPCAVSPLGLVLAADGA